MRNGSGGSLTISDKNIETEMSLLDLRRNLSIIPQEPFIFRDTFRRNIDPLSEATDDQIWDVLRVVGLDKKIGELSG